MKKSVFCAIAFGALMAVSVACTLQTTQATMEKSVLRLHVRANSNSRQDQELKMKVRDCILEKGKDIFASQKDIDGARVAAAANLDALKSAAEKEIKANGYSYPVDVRLSGEHFPAKHYGSIYIPSGNYEALVVDIGDGVGDNWWCVMFPPLCFVNEACEKLPHDSEEILIDNLGAKNYAMLTDTKPAIKFKVYELWKELQK